MDERYFDTRTVGFLPRKGTQVPRSQGKPQILMMLTLYCWNFRRVIHSILTLSRRRRNEEFRGIFCEFDEVLPCRLAAEACIV